MLALEKDDANKALKAASVLHDIASLSVSWHAACCTATFRS